MHLSVTFCLSPPLISLLSLQLNYQYHDLYQYYNNYQPVLRPSQIHHHFTPQALLGALKRASQKRRKDRDDRMADRRDMKDETSRSESQSSEAPTTRTMQAMNGEY